MSELKKWLDTSGYLKASKNIQKPTHLLLDGGKVYLPSKEEKKFIQNYAIEVHKGSKVYYVESRPKIFKYMVDIDVGDDHYWTKDEIMNITKFVNGIVNQFYDSGYTVICCTAPEKQKKKSIHTGIHLIWPKLFITAQTALMLRNAILQKVNEEFPKRDPERFQNSWEDIFDKVIYVSNGYRMVGSDKLNPETRKPENRPYWPIFAIDAKGEKRVEYMNRLLDDVTFLITDTSIRYVPSAFRKANPNGMVPSNVPNWVSNEVRKPVKTTNSNNIIESGTQEFATIDYLIRKRIPEYSHERKLIRDIRRNPDDSIYISSDSRYCTNIGRDHHSCGIYFQITRQGIFQKCFCPCDNLRGRKHGYCRDFVSKCYTIPTEMTRILFPDVQFRTVLPSNTKSNKSNKSKKEEAGEKEEDPFEIVTTLKKEKKTEKETEKSEKKKIKKKAKAIPFVPRTSTKNNRLSSAKSECDKLFKEI